MRREVMEFMHRVKGAILIPKGTHATMCEGGRCQEMIYFVGKQPVSVEPYLTTMPGIAPTSSEDGCGLSHFANCIDRAQFKRKR